MQPLWRIIRFGWTMLREAVRLQRSLRQVEAAARDSYRAQRLQQAAQALCKVMRIRVSCEDDIPADGALLAVSNHIGVLDPFIVASQLPITIVAKAEMRSWPLVGWMCRVAGVIFVERERRSQVGSFIEAVQARLRMQVRVLVFAEGTTSHGDSVLPFKTGAFQAVAGMEDGAVLPLFIEVVSVNGEPADARRRRALTWAGGEESMARNIWKLAALKEAHVRVRVGGRIPTRGQNRKTLATDTRRAVLALGGLVEAE